MHYSPSDIEKLKEVQRDTFKGNATDEQIGFIQSLYRGIFNRELNKSCSQCWNDAIDEILSYDRNKMSDQKFILRVGAVLTDAAHEEMNCCHRDCTDEKAIHHIKFAIAYDQANPGYTKLLDKTLAKFAVLPENWRELLDGKPQGDQYENLTIPQIKELLRAKAYVDKDFTFKSREKLLEMLIAP